MRDARHGALQHVRGTELTGDTAQTSGLTRFEAVSGKTVGSSKTWTGMTLVAPATNSGDHHHGETETSIYAVSGNPVFVYAAGDTEVRLETEPGDFIFVPPYAPHREENPGGTEAVVVISRSSQGHCGEPAEPLDAGRPAMIEAGPLTVVEFTGPACPWGFGEQSPMGRAAEPDEIAPPYIFFASNRLSSFYTGQNLVPAG